MRDSKIALVCVMKEHLNRGAFYLVLLIGICLIPLHSRSERSGALPQTSSL